MKDIAEKNLEDFSGADTITATARGDLDADGDLSTFTLS